MANYLYNGVELPAPPSYSSSTYPYAIITAMSGAFMNEFLTSGGYSHLVGVVDILYSFRAASYPYRKITPSGADKGRIYYTIYPYTKLKRWCFAYGAGISTWLNIFDDTSGSEKGYYIPYPEQNSVIWTNYNITTTSGSVYYKGSTPVPVSSDSSDTSKVTGIQLVSADSVTKGTYITVSAAVQGTGNYDNSSTGSISGNKSSNTKLVKNGNIYALHCGIDETSSSITVTIKSVQDTSIKASKSITVIEATKAATPKITSIGSSKTYQIDTVPDKLTCNATVSDGGTLSYTWYNSSGVAVSYSSSFYPPTNELGTKYYYCIVTNTLNGDTASEISGTVAITIIDEEENPQTPIITSYGNSSAYIVNTVSDRLTCIATVSDGGTLSYTWYNNSGIAVSYSSSFYPPTNEIGTKKYYCVVTNTLNGKSVNATSGTVSITVIADDSGDDSGGGTGGGDSGGTGGDNTGGDSGGTGGDDSGSTGGDSGITPEGTLEITENGTYDVTYYETVNVNVPIPDDILHTKSFQLGIVVGMKLRANRE